MIGRQRYRCRLHAAHLWFTTCLMPLRFHTRAIQILLLLLLYNKQQYKTHKSICVISMLTWNCENGNKSMIRLAEMWNGGRRRRRKNLWAIQFVHFVRFPCFCSIIILSFVYIYIPIVIQFTTIIIIVERWRGKKNIRKRIRNESQLKRFILNTRKGHWGLI
jgi:hypothetical protein